MNTNKHFSHIPVLLNEAVEALEVSIGKKYIDATLGGGGHTDLILKLGGVVLGLDRDNEAIEFVSKKQKAKIKEQKLRVVQGNFSVIKKLAEENGFSTQDGGVDGILFDLGVSSHQLDSAGRGFSIKKDERLDMRMDKIQSLSAYEVVNSYPREDLVRIFYTYGEEHNAERIAREIVETRKKKEIVTTKDLSSIIEGISHKSEAIHPATRVFQAIRIEVNGELDALKRGLADGFDLLNANGRMVVISFHSLEDRAVKQAFERFKTEEKGVIITKKPIIATFQELSRNKRARSAKMRVILKI
jgi:16S rRNA (cytosine1402-N4)-methyltransferase